MVHLKDILYDNEMISCLYSPENCGEYRKIEYDIKTNIFMISKFDNELDSDFYLSAIKHKLKSFLKNNSFPKEYNLCIY